MTGKCISITRIFWLALALQLSASAPCLALELRPSRIPPEKFSQLQRFIDDSFGLMPSKLRTAVQDRVSIEFSEPDPENPIQSICPSKQAIRDKRPHVLAKVKERKGRFTVQLHPLLIEAVLNGEDGSPKSTCGHGTVFRLSQAQVVHEIAHVYDFLNVESQSEKESRSACAFPTEQPVSEECQRLLRKTTTVSESFEFTKTMGWRSEGLTGFDFKNKGDTIRSADGSVQRITRRGNPYEGKNVHESFAVNMENWVLDPTYRCRRPLAAEFLERHFGETRVGDCEINDKVIAASTGDIVSLDPKRVYQVHYLLAGTGDSISSRFGHSMYRIVLCAPERKEVGPECLKDTQHHVVLSYRANLKEVSPDYVSLLTGGKYPSQLFILPFPEVLEEYTKIELREITSVPLKLSEDEKRRFLRHANEQFWSYSGDYAFVGNNCATESRDLLQAVLPADHAFQKSTAFSPKGVLQDMLERGVIDRTDFKRAQEEKRPGFYFGSHAPALHAAVDVLVKFGALDSGLDLQRYTEVPAKERERLFAEALRKPGIDRKKVSGAFWLLENHIRRLHDKKILDKAVEAAIDAQKEPANLSEAARELFERTRALIEARVPQSAASPGYGIPLEREMELNPALVELEQKRTLQLFADIGLYLEKIFTDPILEGRATLKNLDCFGRVYKDAARN